ncbi:Hypothetical predicted protein [Xyrichtys novacula]|uniref:Uncharacterized protein n=1 Tax=Xyrichtys novacula TaxID=13765 RepID=A0AAV1FJP8_XYRNO|nr:Hypothetical predicted protein [Xyrichtys novacula]
MVFRESKLAQFRTRTSPEGEESQRTSPDSGPSTDPSGTPQGKSKPSEQPTPIFFTEVLKSNLKTTVTKSQTLLSEVMQI